MERTPHERRRADAPQRPGAGFAGHWCVGRELCRHQSGGGGRAAHAAGRAAFHAGGISGIAVVQSAPRASALVLGLWADDFGGAVCVFVQRHSCGHALGPGVPGVAVAVANGFIGFSLLTLVITILAIARTRIIAIENVAGTFQEMLFFS